MGIGKKLKELCITMEDLYRHMGITRQGYHQRSHQRKVEKAMAEEIKPMVKDYRKNYDRRAGSRTLYYNLNIKTKFNIGITQFENLMSSHEMTLLPLRIRVVTTKSDHQSWNYPNRISGLKINMINKVVAGDLTYVYLGPSLYYVFSLIDLYSNRVVGIHIGNRMRSEDAKKALEGWVRLRGENELINCIHHTDGGSQYFSVLYLEALSEVKVVSSVAGTCLENGNAEQWNGLFKYHFIPTVETQSLALLGPEIENICYFYNHKRKQRILGWRTPVEFEEYIQGLPEENRPVKKLHNFSEKPKKA